MSIEQHWRGIATASDRFHEKKYSLKSTKWTNLNVNSLQWIIFIFSLIFAIEVISLSSSMKIIFSLIKTRGKGGENEEMITECTL